MAPREQRVLSIGFGLLGGNAKRLQEQLTSPTAKKVGAASQALREAQAKKAARQAVAQRQAKDAEQKKEAAKALEPELSFVDLELLDADGKPVEGVRYKVQDPFGHVKEGKTDAQGKAHVDGVAKGLVTVSFPDVDGDEWWNEEMGHPKVVDLEKRRAQASDFLELELVGDDGKPLAGQPYVVEDANGTAFEGELDQHGYARIQKVAKGRAKVFFPGLDVRDFLPTDAS